MRKEARHTQMRDRALGVHPDILEHLPPKKNRSLPTVLLYALTCDFTGGCPPPPSRSLCQRVNFPRVESAFASALTRPVARRSAHGDADPGQLSTRSERATHGPTKRGDHQHG